MSASGDDDGFPTITGEGGAVVDIDALTGVGRVSLYCDDNEHYDSRRGLVYLTPAAAREAAAQLLKAARWAEGTRDE